MPRHLGRRCRAASTTTGKCIRGCCWPRPARSISRVPKAGNRIHVGKGYSNGQHTEPHGAPKQLHVRFGATRSARAGKLPAERAEAASGKSPVNSVRLSLRKTFPALKGANIPRHVSSASMCLPGWPGTGGGYARSPPQNERARRLEEQKDGTRCIQLSTASTRLEKVLVRYAAPRPGAADGKRPSQPHRSIPQPWSSTTPASPASALKVRRCPCVACRHVRSRLDARPRGPS